MHLRAFAVLNIFSGDYTPPPDSQMKGLKVGRGFKRNSKGGTQGSEGNEWGREGQLQKGNKGREGNERGQQKGAGEGKGLGEAQCSRMTF
jgi:hypothetical protein